jgi:hypothetical protein
MLLMQEVKKQGVGGDMVTTTDLVYPVHQHRHKFLYTMCVVYLSFPATRPRLKQNEEC